MLTSHRNKIVAGLAALAALVVVGAALGATGALSPRQESEAIVNDAAEQLGVEPSELSAALKQALKNRVDAAVEAGRLTEAEGTAMKARIDAGEVPLFGLGPRHHGPHRLHGGLAAAASYLGMTQANLRAALEDGKTLAQVARDRGKTVNGLVAAMVADTRKKLAEAVEDGRLTQAQSRAIQSDLKARITELVNEAMPERLGPRGFPHREAALGPAA
jgi:hypothetical protein